MCPGGRSVGRTRRPPSLDAHQGGGASSRGAAPLDRCRAGQVDTCPGIGSGISADPNQSMPGEISGREHYSTALSRHRWIKRAGARMPGVPIVPPVPGGAPVDSAPVGSVVGRDDDRVDERSPDIGDCCPFRGPKGACRGAGRGARLGRGVWGGGVARRLGGVRAPGNPHYPKLGKCVALGITRRVRCHHARGDEAGKPSRHLATGAGRIRHQQGLQRSGARAPNNGSGKMRPSVLRRWARTGPLDLSSSAE